MSDQARKIQLPKGSQIASVKLINPVSFGPAIINRFMAPMVPGLETFKTSPSLCFLIEHPSGRKLVWDLGIREDYTNYATSIANYLPSTKYDFQFETSVASTLKESGIALEDIEAIIWSKGLGLVGLTKRAVLTITGHWDHIGDPSTFPKTTDLVVGPGFKKLMLPGFPANPSSPILESDYSGRNLREIAFDGPDSLSIGQFPAFDYFGDGSFYLLDSPGHAIGHLCGLARTSMSPDTFVLMGGDVCHYSGIMRPSKHLPMPATISPNPCHPKGDMPLCPGHAWEELQNSRGREATDTLFDLTFGLDIPLATKTVGQLQELDCHEDVFVIIAHDSTVRDGVPHFPESLNTWKQQGWGQKLKWAFLRDLELYWKSKQLA